MFEDQRNSDIDSSKHVLATHDETAQAASLNSTSSAAYGMGTDSSAAASSDYEHQMSTADIDIDDLDLETLERLTNPDATEKDVQSALDSIASSDTDSSNIDPSAPSSTLSPSEDTYTDINSGDEFNNIDADAAFGLTSDENVKAIIAGLDDSANDDTFDSNEDQTADIAAYASADTTYDAPAADTDAADDAAEAAYDAADQSNSADDHASQDNSSVDELSTAEGEQETDAADSSADTQSTDESASEIAEDGAVVSGADFDSAATDDDDSFLSDIASALEDSELFEQELAESIAGTGQYGAMAGAALSDDYKITPDSHVHIHQDYEVINPHPAALESAAEAARRFNAMADHADEMDQDTTKDSTESFESEGFDDSELEAALSSEIAKSEITDEVVSDNSAIIDEQAFATHAPDVLAAPLEDTAMSTADENNDALTSIESTQASETLSSTAIDSDTLVQADTQTTDAYTTAPAQAGTDMAADAEASTDMAVGTDAIVNSGADEATTSAAAAASTASEGSAAESSADEAIVDVQDSGDAAAQSKLGEDNPYAGLDAVDDSADESFNADLAAQMAAAQEAMAQSLAEQAAQKEVEDNGIHLVSADRFRSVNNIMSDAQMMSNEGHTAIQGLENRQKPKAAPRKNTNITGLSEEDLATLRQINELNANKRKRHQEAEARFNAQIAQEQGMPYDEALLREPEPVQGESSTIISGSGANEANLRVANAQNSYASDAQDNYADSYSGVAAPINRSNDNNEYQDNNGQFVSSNTYSADDGISVQSADRYDEFSANDGTYAKSATTQNPYINTQGQNQDIYSSNSNQRDYSYNEYDENEVQAMPAQRQAAPQDDGPVYYVGQRTEQQVQQSAPEAEDNIYLGTYADRMAKKKEAQEAALQAANSQSSAPETSNTYITGAAAAQDNYASLQEDNPYIAPNAQDTEDSPYITPGVHDREDSPYITPGVQEPKYYVGPSNSQDDVAPTAPVYEPSPYITPGVRTPEELAAEAAEREAAMARAQEQARLAEQARLDKEARIAEQQRQAELAEQQRQAKLAKQERAQEMSSASERDRQNQAAPEQRIAAVSTDSVSESDLVVPAGMADGGAFSMQADAADQYSGNGYEDGPHYYVGAKEPSAPMQEAQNEVPIYAVGVGHSNAEVEANIQATRSKLQHDRALPPSYLDGEGAYEGDQESNGKSDEDLAYEEALAAAARESMAAPHSEVIANARKLAAEQDARYAKLEAQKAAEEQLNAQGLVTDNLTNYQDKSDSTISKQDSQGASSSVASSDSAAAAEPSFADAVFNARQELTQDAPRDSYESYTSNERDTTADYVSSVSADEQATAMSVAKSVTKSQEVMASQGQVLAMNAEARPHIDVVEDSAQWQNETAAAQEASAAAAQAAGDNFEASVPKMRRDEHGTANFANLTAHESVGLGMTVFLYLRQLLAAFFTHTNLPIIAPKTAAKLGPCYPSSMALPYLFVGMLSGFLASSAQLIIEVDTVGTISFIVFLLCTGLTPYRGVYRICSYISRRRHDVTLVAASVTMPMIMFMWLSNILIMSSDGIAEATAAFGIAAMLSAAGASTLTWSLPQDPMDSSGTMTTKGLLFVIVISIMAAFGVMHYITGLSLIGLCIATRLVFGMIIAGNNGTSHRSYVHALQLLTMFILLFDLIILKSQGYNILSASSLDFINQLRTTISP